MILAPDFLVFSFWFLVFVYYAVTQLATQLPQRRIQNLKFLAKKIQKFQLLKPQPFLIGIKQFKTQSSGGNSADEL